MIAVLPFHRELTAKYSGLKSSSLLDLWFVLVDNEPAGSTTTVISQGPTPFVSWSATEIKFSTPFSALLPRSVGWTGNPPPLACDSRRRRANHFIRIQLPKQGSLRLFHCPAQSGESRGGNQDFGPTAGCRAVFLGCRRLLVRLQVPLLHLDPRSVTPTGNGRPSRLAGPASSHYISFVGFVGEPDLNDETGDAAHLEKQVELEEDPTRARNTAEQQYLSKSRPHPQPRPPPGYLYLPDSTPASGVLDNTTRPMISV